MTNLYMCFCCRLLRRIIHLIGCLTYMFLYHPLFLLEYKYQINLKVLVLVRACVGFWSSLKATFGLELMDKWSASWQHIAFRVGSIPRSTYKVTLKTGNNRNHLVNCTFIRFFLLIPLFLSDCL